MPIIPIKAAMFETASEATASLRPVIASVPRISSG